MSLLSPNPEERETTLRAVVRRALAEASVSDTEAARALGRSRQRFERQLRDDETGGLRLADLLVLERLMPGLVGRIVAGAGLDVVPRGLSSAATDIMTALGVSLASIGKVAEETATALPGGVDHVEAHRISRACDRLCGDVRRLQATVTGAVK